MNRDFLVTHFRVLPFTLRFHSVWNCLCVSGNVGQVFVFLNGSGQSVVLALLTESLPFPSCSEAFHCCLLRTSRCLAVSGLPETSLSPCWCTHSLLTLSVNFCLWYGTHPWYTISFSFPPDVRELWFLLVPCSSMYMLSAYQKTFKKHWNESVSCFGRICIIIIGASDLGTYYIST